MSKALEDGEIFPREYIPAYVDDEVRVNNYNTGFQLLYDDKYLPTEWRYSVRVGRYVILSNINNVTYCMSTVGYSWILIPYSRVGKTLCRFDLNCTRLCMYRHSEDVESINNHKQQFILWDKGCYALAVTSIER